MRRIASTPRADWQKKVEAIGLTWHTSEHHAYWNESAFYEFTAQEVDLFASATYELEEMACQAAQHVIDNRLYSKLGIPELAVSLIEHSWEAEPPSPYGRFDLMYDGCHPPKLLEYNADTPTALLEAAVVQWYGSRKHTPPATNSIPSTNVSSRGGRISLRTSKANASIFVRWTTPKIGPPPRIWRTRRSRRDSRRPSS